MEEKILELLRQPDYTPLTVPELLAPLGLPRNEQRQLERLLERMERSGQVARIKQGNRYVLPLEADLVPGIIRMNRQGTGFLQPDDPKLPTIRIAPDATSTAWHGDRVLVRREVTPRVPGRAEPREPSGRVVRVLERKRTQLVGTLQRGRQFLFVIPDDPRIVQDIYVPPPSDVGRPAREGDKVVVEVREWKSRHTNPEGEIIEVLGPPDAEGVDMLSVLRQYQLPLHFPKAALQEAHAIGTEVKPAEIVGRVDCRRHQTVTIDPEDAKDFDDAICLQPAGQGQWKLWVHIADVSHYVKPGTALDAEAFRRGNSTYLVDRVIPMLPEALSNDLCSLKPQVDRLTKCVEFLLSAEGQVLRSHFYPAVIHSQRRYHYKEVFGILQAKPRDPLEHMLHDANALAQKIRRARFKAGSLDLDFPETKIRLDDQGRVLRLEKVENDISHQLIEEFMLLANEAVATRLMALNRPALYRIHEPPDEKRLQEYREDVLGHQIPCGNLSNRHEVQKLLEKLNHLPIGQALKIGFLKSLMRARYAVEPLGHYGLAKKKYTHFTSPIRRFADLVVHRALFPDSARAGAMAPASSQTQFSSSQPVAQGRVRNVASRSMNPRSPEISEPGPGHSLSPPMERAGLRGNKADELAHSGASPSLSRRAVAEIGQHLSETERNSDDAERDSRDVKLFAFLNAQLKSSRPQPYPGLVTDVRNFGFFVDVTGLGMSGLVPLSGLTDDFYQFEPRRAQLIGRRTRRIIKLGDKVQVQVAKVDTFKRQVDFKLAEAPGEVRRPEQRARGQAGFKGPRRSSNRR